MPVSLDGRMEPLIGLAVRHALRSARRGGFRFPHEFTTTPDGVSVLCLRSSDLPVFVFGSDAGRELFGWLPEGNRRGVALREVLAKAGWLVVDGNGRAILRDRAVHGVRLPLVAMVRTTGAA